MTDTIDTTEIPDKAVKRKFFLKSKTFWFNVAILLTAGATQLEPVIGMLDLEEGTADALRLGILVSAGLGNLILRFVTSEPVRVGKE